MEYKDLIELKTILEFQLKEIDFNILTFPLRGSDEEFDFLLKKAINYRDFIKKINSELNLF